MAKRKAKKVSPLASLIFIAVCVLLILNFCLPLLSTQGSISGLGSTEKTNHNLFELLEDISDTESSTLSAFVVFSLISAIVGVLGAAFAAACIVKPKLGKWLKVVGVLIAIVAIVTFVLAIVAANDNSGSVWVVSAKTSIGIAPILTLVGGLGALVTPWIIK